MDVLDTLRFLVVFLLTCQTCICLDNLNVLVRQIVVRHTTLTRHNNGTSARRKNRKNANDEIEGLDKSWIESKKLHLLIGDPFENLINLTGCQWDVHLVGVSLLTRLVNGTERRICDGQYNLGLQNLTTRADINLLHTLDNLVEPDVSLVLLESLKLDFLL